ncbi:MAG: toxin-antitoxin system YwqK family antitoxin [Bacteroidia bacterium]
MKKLIFISTLVFTYIFSAAQQLNDKGLYITGDGELFTGILTAQKENVKSELTVKDGIVNGEAVYYYASGKVMETGMFNNGKKDQKWIRYNESGTTNAVAFYNMGKKTGTWLVYDDNGKKRFEMNYIDGEKSGTWTNWDENGMVVSTKNYSISN